MQHYQTFQDAEANLGRFIADVDNTKRLHASPGSVPPVEFEATRLAHHVCSTGMEGGPPLAD